MSTTHSSENSVNVEIPLKSITDENINISQYSEFRFYEKFCFKDDADIYPSEPRRWLGISHRKGRLTCYHILTQTGKGISRSTVQWVTNLELSPDEAKETLLSLIQKLTKG